MKKAICVNRIYVYLILFFNLQNSFEHWRPVFFVGASVYVVSAIFFILFGTGNIQSWNFGREDTTEEKEDREKNGDLKEMNGTTAKKVETKDVKETSLNVG